MARTRAITILFVDLVASTERRARLGDDLFDEFTGRFVATLRAAVADHNGQEVKSAGDGLMVVFAESVVDAITCAADMHEAVNSLDDDAPPRLRIGISTGEVAEEGSDYQGMPIVEAARLEAAAEPGQTLTTSVVRSLVGTRRGLRFRDIGPLTLKGLPSPLPTVEVVDDQAIVAQQTASASTVASRSSRRRWPIVTGVAVSVVTIAAAGAFIAIRKDERVSSAAGVTSPKGYTPTFEPGPCPDRITNAAPNATCGQLVVPQDRTKPAGQQIRLLVTRTPPRVAGASADPTIDTCGCENPANSVARDHGELINMTSRGWFGTDPPMTCPDVTAAQRGALSSRADDPVARAKVLAAVSTCRARLVAQGIDPTQYNADQASLDFLDLMVALRIRRADFIANSENDTIVFGILRRAPAAIRSMTLDNPVPPGASLLTNPTNTLASAFARYVDLCHSNAVCSSGYPDIDGAYKRLIASLHDNPVLVDAAVPNDSSAPPIPVLLDSERGAQALSAALSDPTTYPAIPAVLSEATPDVVAGDVLLAHDDLLWDDQAPWFAWMSYYCSYDIHTFDQNSIALASRTYPDFAADLSQWSDWCRVWNVPDLSARLSVDVSSPVPVLMFRGDLSPNGDADWIRTLLRGFPNGQALLFPTLGDDLLETGPPCLSDLRRQFLSNPMTRLDTNACVAQSPPIQFTAPG